MRGNGISTEPSLGAKLKMYRTKRKLSLMELAARSGISKSLISQIERSLVNPSVATIRSLARALEIPVFLLFLDDEPRGDLVRHDQRRRLFLPGSTVERHVLTPEHRQRFVLLTMNVHPDEPSAVELTQHTGEECVYVRTGSLTVQLGNQEIVLEEGDSLYFDALVPHRFINCGRTVAEVISCIAPGVPE
jgi:transcriptional regulator with XRE-family HTH domain